ELAVRARKEADLVLPLRVDVDERDPGLPAPLDVEPYPGRLEPPQRLVGEGVVADGADHRHVGAEPCGRDRLVRALAPGRAHELPAADRLTGARKAVDAEREVEVDRPHDRQR